jgi:hypothetical protein
MTGQQHDRDGEGTSITEPAIEIIVEETSMAEHLDDRSACPGSSPGKTVEHLQNVFVAATTIPRLAVTMARVHATTNAQ